MSFTFILLGVLLVCFSTTAGSLILVFTASSIVRDFGRVEYMSFTFILLGVLLVCFSPPPTLEAGRGPWADDSLLPIILVSLEGIGESWAGVRVCTSSCLALNTSSSSSTFTLVT